MTFEIYFLKSSSKKWLITVPEEKCPSVIFWKMLKETEQETTKSLDFQFVFIKG